MRRVPMGGVELDRVEAGLDAPADACAKLSMQASMSSKVMPGTVYSALSGSGLRS